MLSLYRLISAATSGDGGDTGKGQEQPTQAAAFILLGIFFGSQEIDQIGQFAQGANFSQVNHIFVVYHEAWHALNGKFILLLTPQGDDIIDFLAVGQGIILADIDAVGGKQLLDIVAAIDSRGVLVSRAEWSWPWAPSSP